MSRYRFEPRELPCGHGSRLIIAFTTDGVWEAAYYRPRKGIVVEERFAIVKRILLDALRVLFAEADEPFDADAVIDYIRSTTWGAGLRQLTAKRAPVPMPQDERLAAEHGWEPDPDPLAVELPGMPELEPAPEEAAPVQLGYNEFPEGF